MPKSGARGRPSLKKRKRSYKGEASTRDCAIDMIVSKYQRILQQSMLPIYRARK
jgi:hypothetical protein